MRPNYLLHSRCVEHQNKTVWVTKQLQELEKQLVKTQAPVGEETRKEMLY